MMSAFAIRRQLALFICPELTPVPCTAQARAALPGTPVARPVGFSQAAQAGSSGACVPQDQASAPTAWADLRSQEQAEAWLAAASEAELGEMAAHLLAGHPVSREEAVPQQAILLAQCASEALARRVIEAMEERTHRKYRWHPLESVQ